MSDLLRSFPHPVSVGASAARPLLRPARALILAMVLLSTAGCAHLMASLSGPGITDEDPGRRTLGMVVEDENLQTKILGNLYKLEPRFQEAGIDLESFNGIVLMAGNVHDESMVQLASTVARKMRNVRNVHNELRVGPPPEASQRAADAWLAGKVRFVMRVTRDFPASRVHVVVNGGTVYLMGLVSQQEAADAVDIIGRVDGIKRIVKVFEYIAEGRRAPDGLVGTHPHSPAPQAAEPQGIPGFPAGSEAVEQDADFRTAPIDP